MGKLVIKFQGRQVADVNLRLGDMTIGRHADCDIVLQNDKSVSGKHALIRTVGRKSTLEDLDSTNGTFIESGRIKRHELRHGETFIIGAHELIYRDDVSLDAPMFGKGSGASAVRSDSRDKTTIISMQARLVAMDGRDKGKTVPLVKKETVLDNPGKNPARIYHGPDGYVLHAQAGPGEPRLNDKPVMPGGQLLESGDILEIAGTRYEVVI